MWLGKGTPGTGGGRPEDRRLDHYRTVLRAREVQVQESRGTLLTGSSDPPSYVPVSTLPRSGEVLCHFGCRSLRERFFLSRHNLDLSRTSSRTGSLRRESENVYSFDSGFLPSSSSWSRFRSREEAICSIEGPYN